jgi:hypothetical protein
MPQRTTIGRDHITRRGSQATMHSKPCTDVATPPQSAQTNTSMFRSLAHPRT